MPRESLAVAAGGFASFFNLYALQSLLPAIRAEFHASHALAGMTITTSFLALALGSLGVGQLLQRFPARSLLGLGLAGLVVTTSAGAFSHNLEQLIAWRFLQGLCLPPVLACLMNFIASHWAGRELAKAMSNYVTWTVIGGFVGRLLAGQVCDWWNWRAALLLTALLTGAVAWVLWQTLPQPTPCQPQASPPPVLAPLVPALVLGFGVLFTLVGTFTYIPFHLAEPPFHLGAQALGRMFCVYLLGVVVTPLAGRMTARVGYRTTLLAALVTTLLGLGLSLSHTLPPLLLGLALIASAAFVGQAATTGYVSQLAGPARARALSCYLACYYAGGSLGALLPGLLWHLGGWPICALLLLLVQLLGAWLLLLRFHPEVGRTASTL